MSFKRIFAFLGVVLALVGLAGCAPAPAAVPQEAAATVEPMAVRSRPMLIPTPTPFIDPNNECLSCHSDKDRLIQTAKPEEKAPSESKGEG